MSLERTPRHRSKTATSLRNQCVCPPGKLSKAEDTHSVEASVGTLFPNLIRFFIPGQILTFQSQSNACRHQLLVGDAEIQAVPFGPERLWMRSNAQTQVEDGDVADPCQLRNQCVRFPGKLSKAEDTHSVEASVGTLFPNLIRFFFIPGQILTFQSQSNARRHQLLVGDAEI